MSRTDLKRQLSKQHSILEQQQKEEEEEEKKAARKNVLIEEEKAATGMVRYMYQVFINRHDCRSYYLCVILVHLSHVHVNPSLNCTPVQEVYM